MSPQTVTVDGIPVQIEGRADGPTVLMLHGWPDTLALWDGTVAALRGSHRCVRLTLPGFAPHLPPRAMSLERMSGFLARVVQELSPGAPVTVLAHDWGCMFGYEFLARHPALASRMIAVDIGDHNRGAYLHGLSLKEKLMIMSYQLWLASAWTVGERISTRLGTRMTRWMARAIGYRGDLDAISWQMDYPYAMRWFGLEGGFKGGARVSLTHPTLFLYGKHKPFMFHSQAFLDSLGQTPGCAAQGFPCGHWVMGKSGVEMNAAILKWLG